ncbi:FkbM family methyltransferase [Horticoccus sp. 23ND18S-11]|uniref:FkbM family methyltransferase n=1 Tax=Horticoccus sp. 23ND18S-11 TaxID=3391832 RepID=UPI0039C8FF44
MPSERSLIESFFQMWARVGTPPELIIDVGANRGLWTRLAIKYFPTAQFLMVEPQLPLKSQSADLLDRPNVIWLSAGVSDEVGSLLLTLPPRDDSASFSMSAEDARKAGFPQIEVPVLTLNEIARRAGRMPSIVKIDAEGFDLRVLRGASDLFGKTDVFLVECAICCTAFENTLQAVGAVMHAHGYRIIDITDLNRSPKSGSLWLSEVAFLRESSPVLKHFTSYE